MNRFHPAGDKTAPLTHVVSFHGVAPLERGLCYCLYLLGKHWPALAEHPSWLLSAAREVDHVREHNRQFGTSLHSQQELIDLHERDPARYPAANPVGRTSHCLRSDGSPVYTTPGGRHAGPGEEIRWHQRGIDMLDADVATELVHRARALGLEFVQPYKTGSELHHVVCAKSPTQVLVDRNVVHAR